MESTIKILTEISETSDGNILRIFMSSQEIKMCNKLVKDGLLYKGKSDQKNATTYFAITSEGYKFLENNS